VKVNEFCFDFKIVQRTALVFWPVVTITALLVASRPLCVLCCPCVLQPRPALLPP
jgi:hypothetical protein